MDIPVAEVGGEDDVLKLLGTADDELVAIVHPLHDVAVAVSLNQGGITDRILKAFWMKLATVLLSPGLATRIFVVDIY